MNEEDINKDESVDALTDLGSIFEEQPGNRVMVSEDKMTASVELAPPGEGKSYTALDVVKLLEQNGVVSGVSAEAIDRLVFEKSYYRETDVAFGSVPKNGEDGHYKYFFNAHPRSAPKILQDGSVDYRSMGFFEPVKKDQLIAEYIPETRGTDGCDVYGNIIPARRGRSLPALRGKYIRMDKERRHFYSDVDGMISLDETTGKVTVSQVYQVNGDVDVATGNIRFAGDVLITGTVKSGFSVEASGNVEIGGMVEAATVKAGGDILIKGGVSGATKGFIIAGGDVEGRYFEQANVECDGCLRTNSIMNCYIDSRDEVVLSGTRGILLAGRLHALKGVTAVNIGNEAQIATYIKVGIEPKLRREFEELRKNIDLLTRDVDRLAAAQAQLDAMEIPDDKKELAVHRKQQIMRLKIQKKAELDEKNSKIQALQEEIDAGKKAVVHVSQWAHAGCSVSINGATLNIREDVKGVVFTLRKGNVIMMYEGESD